MPFLQLTLPIGSADPAPFEDALLDAGAESITLEDAGDDPVLEPAPGSTPLWPHVRIKALFAASADPDALRASFPGATFEHIADRAWEREWLKDFRPMRFGQRLWICPGGQRAPLDESVAAPCLIELDPGLAFGTGTHPTTALCLEWLDAAQLQGRFVIDYGCGSGVLAIAALKLGAAGALAIDIDPQALLATRDNAARNGVAERLLVAAPDRAQHPPADVLLANILAEPLVELAPAFAERVAVGGSIVLSGILQSQAAPVASRYAAWFDMRPATTRDDWALLYGVRRS
ncbi:MAG TPA: 50S ribosomal protein L11 methyltransferase [Steroidobacteraceae bacterium]|nr:50S ribosomal protein L11 methyltransferase [Steroidobacteraceae bacterium]